MSSVNSAPSSKIRRRQMVEQISENVLIEKILSFLRVKQNKPEIIRATL